MENLIEKAIADIYEHRNYLRKLANAKGKPEDIEEAYSIACGHVWAYRNLELLSLKAAFDYIGLLANACEGR